MNNHFIYFVLLYDVINVSNHQYINTNRKLVSQSSCDSSKTALVEHFFNLIFSEFHNTPPICVCVQMCIDQSTYCYPNGCLRKSEPKKQGSADNIHQSTLPPSSVPNEARKKPIMFLFDDNNQHMTHFLTDNFVDGIQGVKPARPTKDELHVDPFDDRYKMFNKFKSVPKVELKYNLREQVKNKKNDLLKVETIDVTKTRWPLSKRVRVNGQTVYSEDSSKNNRLNRIPKINKPTKSFQGEADPVILRYFKRDSRNRRDDNVNDDSVYSLEKNEAEADNTMFSLEALIDNLIEHSLDVNNKSDIDLSIQLIDPLYNETSAILYTNGNANNIIHQLRNDYLNLTSNNHTSDNNNKKIFIEENFRTILNDMISTISSHIDKQNNIINTTLGATELIVKDKLDTTTEINMKNDDLDEKSNISGDTTQGTYDTLTEQPKMQSKSTLD